MGLDEALSKMAYYYVGKKDILEQDLEKAFKWCEKAYEQGYRNADLSRINKKYSIINGIVNEQSNISENRSRAIP